MGSLACNCGSIASQTFNGAVSGIGGLRTRVATQLAVLRRALLRGGERRPARHADAEEGAVVAGLGGQRVPDRHRHRLAALHARRDEDEEQPTVAAVAAGGGDPLPVDRLDALRRVNAEVTWRRAEATRCFGYMLSGYKRARRAVGFAAARLFG